MYRAVAVLMVTFIIAAFGLLWLIAHVLRWRDRRRPDVVWKPAGVRYTFTGHDQEQGERGRLAAIERGRATSKAADVAPKRSAVIYSLDDERRSRR